MLEWFESLTHLQQIFLIFAIIGTLLFVIQLVLILVGGGDADADMDTDVGHGGGDIGDTDIHGDHAHASSDASFKLLSFQGLTAFFMMFGFVGLAMNRGSGHGATMSVLVGIAAGFGCMWLVAKLFQLFHRLQSSGTLDLRNAVGQQARVYLKIKENGTGQIEVPIQGHLKVYDAVCETGEEIPTDARVEVVAVKGGIMVVKPR